MHIYSFAWCTLNLMAVPRGPTHPHCTHQTTQTKPLKEKRLKRKKKPNYPNKTVVGQKDEGEKDGGSVIPEPLTPYPYIATAFFTVIFVNTPLKPYLATGFKTRKLNSYSTVTLTATRQKPALTPCAWASRCQARQLDSSTDLDRTRQTSTEVRAEPIRTSLLEPHSFKVKVDGDPLVNYTTWWLDD